MTTEGTKKHCSVGGDFAGGRVVGQLGLSGSGVDSTTNPVA